ncbi:MAG: hypothetical protein CUN54_08930, partial [Phototrophicales bacterium]
MRVTYVLDRPVLGGGVKVVFQHGNLLCRAGHDVTILANGPQPDWVHFQGNYIDFSTGLPALPEQDVIIATYYTTINIAQRIQPGAVIHYCQGYEASYAHLADVAP